MQKRLSQRQSVLIWLIFFSLTSRVFIPAGYMPAPLDEGWPVMSCPSNMDGMVSMAHPAAMPSHGTPEGHHNAHPAHEDSDHEQQGENAHCYIGAFFSASFQVEAVDSLSDVPPLAGWHKAESNPFASTWSPIRTLPRGPPA